MITIYLDLDKDNRVQGWGTQKEQRGNTTPVTIAEDHSFLSQPGFVYWYLNDNEELCKDEELRLTMERENKLAELNKSCRADIVHGFDTEMEGKQYHFYYSETDQQNMLQNKYVIELGADYVYWHGYDSAGTSVAFKVDEAKFNHLFQQAVAEKNRKLHLLHNHYPKLLDSLQDLEDIRAVQWSSLTE